MARPPTRRGFGRFEHTGFVGAGRHRSDGADGNRVGRTGPIEDGGHQRLVCDTIRRGRHGVCTKA